VPKIALSNQAARVPVVTWVNVKVQASNCSYGSDPREDCFRSSTHLPSCLRKSSKKRIDRFNVDQGFIDIENQNRWFFPRIFSEGLGENRENAFSSSPVPVSAIPPRRLRLEISPLLLIERSFRYCELMAHNFSWSSTSIAALMTSKELLQSTDHRRGAFR
jgi:hypothetical protein